MKKRMLGLFLGLVLIINLSVTVNAADDTMSTWAVEEVTAAIERGMVPESLMSNYQTDIKRYEYVVLANQLIELQGKTANVTRYYPFTDILGHAYEDDIVLAYNAGIIEGDGNGSFRPDDYINRQEICTLVVNLVKYLEGIETLKVPVKYTYSDISDISDWALTNVHYCYNNKIMQGVGKDGVGRDIIEPLGNATREQAIILLYRLSNSLGLFDLPDLGTIELVTYDDIQISGQEPTKIYQQSEIVNTFAKTFGEAIALHLIELAVLESVDVLEMTEEYTLLSFENEGTISVSKSGLYIDVNMKMVDLPSDNLLSQYTEIVNILYPTDTLESTIYRELLQLQEDERHTFFNTVGDDDYLKIFSEEIVNDVFYLVQYQFKVN